jgi:hypothetical protein
MTIIVRLIAILLALALLVVLAPRVRTELQMRALRVSALFGPRPTYLTHRFVDKLLAFHRATFGAARMGAGAVGRHLAVGPHPVLPRGADPAGVRRARAAAAGTSVNSIKARIRTLTRTIRAAKFRAYNAENYIAGRPFTLSITDVLLPPLGQKIPITELELLEQALASGTVNDDVIQQIYDDAETNVRATRARMQLARGDVITDGKFSLVGENGLTLDADFSLRRARTSRPPARCGPTTPTRRRSTTSGPGSRRWSPTAVAARRSRSRR